MGKQFWRKHEDGESRQSKPGCIWGLVRVLDSHCWRCNVLKIIQRDKFKSLKRDSSSAAANLYCLDGYKAEKIFDGDDTPCLHAKKSNTIKNQSFGVRVQALIGQEIPKEKGNVNEKEGFYFKTKLQGAYSIHSLESLNVDWKHSLVLLPGDVENYATQSADTAESKTAGKEETGEGKYDVYGPIDAAIPDYNENPDILDIFKVNKGLLIKHLKNADETIANFSRTALGLNKKSKLSRSRSFPFVEMSEDQHQQLKPSKLESKRKEVWSVRRANKFQAVSTFPWSAGKQADDDDESNSTSWKVREAKLRNHKVVMSVREHKRLPDVSPYLENFEEFVDQTCENTMGDEEPVENGDGSSTLHRSSSLNESLDKYGQLFENSFGSDVNLIPKGLKLSNAYVDIIEHFRRTRSLSNVDISDSNSDFEAAENSVILPTIVALPINSIDGCDRRHGKEDYDDSSLCFHKSVAESEKGDGLNNEADYKLKNKDWLGEQETISTGITNKEIAYQDFSFSSDICLQQTDSRAVELPTSIGLAQASIVDELNFSFHSDDLKRLQSKYPSTHRLLNIEQVETFDKIAKNSMCNECLKSKDSDLCYVRHLLDQSGIASDPSEVTWHTTDQPLSPKLFEKVEACWPHQKDQLDRWPDFYGCWHHQMLFDLVNEVILDVYNVSLPYYPKALSSSCHVCPFPLGNSIVEEVSESIGAFLNLKAQLMLQSIDCIVAGDLVCDRSWMNLQMETEYVGIKLEDMIFDEVLEEVLFSRACGFEQMGHGRDSA